MKKILGTLTLILGGITVGLLASEIIVRQFFPGPLVPRFVADTGFGVRGNQPNATIRHFMPGEYDVIINNNSSGMRGSRDYSTEKPRDTYRVAMIGDSFIWGNGVNDDEVISAVMEDRLNSAAPEKATNYEVLNFGVSGFGQAEELITYRKKIRLYSPDEVIIFYFNNDIGNNQVPNLFYLDDNGALQPTGKSYLPAVKVREILHAIAPLNWLMTHSQTWNLIRNRLSSLIHKILLKKQGLKSFSQSSQKGLALTEALFKSLILEARQDGAVVTVVLIPERIMKSNFPFDEQFIIESGATLVDGRNILNPDQYYVRDGHWRPAGHSLMAETLARRTLSMP